MLQNLTTTEKLWRKTKRFAIDGVHPSASMVWHILFVFVVCLYFQADLGNVSPCHLDEEDEEDGKEDIAKRESYRPNLHLKSSLC